MREIAEAARLTKAALYHHFPDKDALYRAAMAESSERLCAHIAAAACGIEDPVDRLRALVHAHMQLFIDEADMIRALYQNLLMPDVSIGVGADQDEEHPMMDALRACAKAGHVNRARVEETFTLLVGGIEYSGVKWLMDPRCAMPSRALGDRLLATAIPSIASRLGRGTRKRPSRSARGRRVAKAIAAIAGGLGVCLTGSTARAAEGGTAGAADMEPTRIDAIEGADVPLDLEGCIDLALEANAALQAERRGRGELAGQKLQALAGGLPSFDLVGSFSRSRDPSFALDETFGGGDASIDSLGFDFVIDPADIPPQSFWRASVDGRWEINPLRIVAAVGAANIGTDRQEAIIEDREHRTTESTLAAYYDVLQSADQLDAFAAELRAREEFLLITRRRFAVEFATALDTLQAAVSLANIRPDYRRAQLDLRNAGSELNVLMGREPLEPLSLVRDVTVETDAVDADHAVALAVRRPEVRELELFERVLRKNRGAQKAESRPYLALNGSYGYVARELDQIGDEGKDTWRVSAALTVPLFDGLLTHGQVKETEARIERARLDRIEAERRARLEVLSLLGELEVARTNLEAATLNMSRAEDALRVMTLTYENGKADYLSVLNAQSDRFRARSNLIEARFEVLTTTASLKRAMGKSPTSPLAAAFFDMPTDGRSE